MNSSIDIYKFDRLTPLLTEISGRPLPEGRRPLSLQNWANRLGYRSPRSVGMVFRGQRLPSVMMINRLSKLLQLNFDQKGYLFALLAFEKLKHRASDAEGDAEDLKKVMDDYNPVIRNELFLDSSKYEILTDWCHIVIRQFLSEKGVRLDVPTIQKRLKGKVSEEQVRQALSNLLKHGLVAYDPNARTYSRKSGSFVTTPDIPSEAVRRYHKQMLTLATEAIEEEAVDDREFATATFAFDRKNLPEVKQLMRKFRDRLEKMYSATETKDVFQLNLQFFSHTTKE